MFGQSENFLETAQALYNDRTAVFIEEYYASGEEEGLRGQISEMDATVEIVGQIPPDTTSRSYLPIGSSAALGTRRHRSKKHSDEDTISFSPNEKHFKIGDRRILQDDPCSGPFLLLRLKITITYVTSDDNLTPEEILMDAFSTPEARDTYLNNYLVGGVAGEAAFGSVACTSELLETNAVPTPAASSAVPTIAVLGSSMPTATVTQPTNNALGNETSLVPTVAFNSTLSSPPVGNVTASLQPTQANVGATGVPTIISVIPDTNSTGSGAPSNGLQTTSTPTLGGNTTTLPPANRENDDEVDDIFGDPQKSVRSSPTHDRKCSNVDTNMSSDTEEIAIRFVYGMETKSQGDYLISDVEDLILDFLTTSVLRCTAGVLQTSVKPRMNRDVIDFGVIRIRYPGNGDITSISKCLVYLVYALTPSGELTASLSLNTTAKTCDATLSEAKDCLVLSTTVLVTASKSRKVEVHRAVLTVLQDAFSKGIFSEFVSDLLVASYLGPDANSFHVVATEANGESTEGGVAIAILFSIAVLAAAALWVCCASPLTRQEVMNKMRTTIPRRKRYSTLTSNDHSDDLAIHRDDAGDYSFEDPSVHFQ